MKKLIWICLVWLPLFVLGQDSTKASLTVFSSGGESFFLYVDGFRQNETPRREVRVDGIDKLFCQVKIEFTDASIPSVTRNRLSVSDGEDNPMDAKYKLVRQGNSVKLRFYSMNSVSQKKEARPVPVNITNPVSVESNTASLTVFSEERENFFLYLNGVQQNTVAQTRIRVDSLPDLYYQVRVVFADPRVPAYTKNNVSVSDGDDQLMDAVYKITRTSGSARLRFYAMNPVSHSPAIMPGTSVYHWGNPGIQAGRKDEPVAVIKDIRQAPAVTENKPEAKPVIRVVDEKPAVVSKEKPAEANRPVVKVEQKPAAEKKAPVPAKPAVPVKENPVQPVAKIPVVKEPLDWVCANEWPMWKADYAAARKNIESAADDKQRLSITDKLLSANCFNTDQVIDIARLFVKEDSRFTFIRSAFRHTIDYRNYHRVSTVFQSEAMKARLEKLLQTGE